MIPAVVHKSSWETAQKQVLDLLKKNKGNPLTIEDIASATYLDEFTVRCALHSISKSTDLCQNKDGFYFPVNKMIWWLVAFGLEIACVYTFFEVIRFYHI